MLCVQNVCVHVEPILIFDRICDDVESLIIYNFYNLPLPRVSLSWQTAQTLMRRRVLQRLIWVYAV